MAETFGERLQRLRTARGLSRYAVSKATGLSQPLLLQLESYKSGAKVKAGTVQRLAAFYQVSIEDLLGEDTPSGLPPSTPLFRTQAAKLGPFLVDVDDIAAALAVAEGETYH